MNEFPAISPGFVFDESTGHKAFLHWVLNARVGKPGRLQLFPPVGNKGRYRPITDCERW